jgi:hypothetical protein
MVKKEKNKRGWKAWPYWLKGGVIGLIIPILSYFLFTLLYIIMILFVSIGFQSSLINSIFVFIGSLLSYGGNPMAIYLLFNTPGSNLEGGLLYAVLLPLSCLFYGLIGAIIGWIYGKIKSRGKK